MLFEIGVDFRRKVVDRSFHWPADKFRLGFRAKFSDGRAGGQRRRFSSFFVSDAGGMPFIEQIDENAEPRQTARKPRIGIHLKEHVLHFVDCHGLSVQRVRKNGLETGGISFGGQRCDRNDAFLLRRQRLRLSSRNGKKEAGSCRGTGEFASFGKTGKVRSSRLHFIPHR